MKSFIPFVVTVFIFFRGTVILYGQNGCWTTKANLLTNRCLHAASAVNNKIYVFSGGDVPNVYESVEEYDPILDRWVTKSNIPTPRWGLTSCTIGEKIYTIGGADINNQRLSTLEVYDPVLDLTDVKDHENQSNILKEYNLQQNNPNPFNPSTTIGYGIQQKSNVKITILNAIGEEVAVVFNEEKEAGYHTVEFNASNLSSGVFFYQIRAGDFIQTKKMILLK